MTEVQVGKINTYPIKSELPTLLHRYFRTQREYDDMLAGRRARRYGAETRTVPTYPNFR